MTRKHKPLPLLQDVVIEAVAAEGKSLFHVDERVVFVPFCVPGDVVDVQITRKKHNYMEGVVVQFKAYSDVRAVPTCQHFGVCGGCKWQNLPYEAQLAAKQQQVVDQLTRIGKVELPLVSPILGSVKVLGYRNKLEFGCANKRWYTAEELAALPPRTEDGAGHLNDSAIGFHITGAFDKIYPIEKCWLMDDLQNRIRNEIYRYAVAEQLSFYDIKAQHGLLRSLMMRNSNTGEFMLLVQFHYDAPDDAERAEKLLEHVAQTFPEISSLLYVDNQKGNDTFADLDLITFR
ncbi:MAG: TRAM domain-containing protein, partial [Prevotella sp.]|nr:TRAM domain-containing protein [Prevotella sp.]